MQFLPSSGRVDIATWTLTKRMEKKVDGKYRRMTRAILNNPGGSTQQSNSCTATYHSSRKLSKLNEPDIRDTVGLSLMDEQRQDDEFEPMYRSSVPIWDVALKTCRKQWTIGKGCERGSRISVLAARHDDNDDDGGNRSGRSKIKFKSLKLP